MVLLSPQEFFRDSVNEAATKNSLIITEATEFYLVNLLTQFIDTKYLFSINSQGKLEEEPLALLFADAFEEPTPAYRAKLCQKIGDISLYVSGFFSESFKKRLVDIDYYISMGQIAYGTAKNLSSGKAHEEVYEEIIEKFNKIVGTFHTISSHYGLKSKTDSLPDFSKILSQNQIQTLSLDYDIIPSIKGKNRKFLD
jgi:hypothetical protein